MKNHILAQHLLIYSCAGATRDEYFQLPTTRNDYVCQPMQAWGEGLGGVWISIQRIVLQRSAYEQGSEFRFWLGGNGPFVSFYLINSIL